MHPPSPATIPTRNTAPEMALRQALKDKGVPFRVQRRIVQGTTRRADIVIPEPRTAVFVDGCFWHCCPIHHVPPERHPLYWQDRCKKIQARDRDTDARLRDLGWDVVHVWEHEDPERAAERVHHRITGWDPVIVATSVGAGFVAGALVNAEFPEGVDLPFVGRAPASVPLAGGAVVGALVARSCGWRRTQRAAVGFAVGSALAAVKR